MLFDDPVSFDEAVQSRAVRELLPTTLSSHDLMKLAAEIREQGVFSARVPYVSHLMTLDDVINRIVDPNVITQNGEMRPRGAGEYMTEARARELLRQSLADISYSPVEGEEGTLKDLASQARIQLQVRMGVDFARGYGQWRVGMDDDVLNEFPAQRLLPSIAENPRSTEFWMERWKEAGLPITNDDDLVALKTDPGWVRLSIFGLPYPPFEWNSQRDLEDVDRDEAISLGLIAPAHRLKGQRRPFDADLSANVPSPAPGGEGLLSAILSAMRGFQFANGILSRATP